MNLIEVNICTVVTAVWTVSELRQLAVLAIRAKEFTSILFFHDLFNLSVYKEYNNRTTQEQ